MSSTRAWTWRHAIIRSDLPATTRHVLLTISCFMNEMGEGCYPTQQRLAEATGLTERAIRTHLEIAEEKGWIRRQQHGFRGQRWRNHTYSAAWPERQDGGEGAERGSDPAGKAAEPPSESSGTSFQKARNDVPPTSPCINPRTSPPGARARAEEEDFKILWDNWPSSHRPDSREAAQAVYRRLSSEDQRRAVDLASTYRRMQLSRKQPALMIPYLGDRVFEELDGAPEIDGDGDFVITADRPEWRAWLADIRRRYGERGVQSVEDRGYFKPKTRWPRREGQLA
jgi:hypothetical protein